MVRSWLLPGPLGALGPAVALALSLAGGEAGAQNAAADTPATRTAVVVAGPQYRAGLLHRWLLGSHYRDLWTTPIEVEVLDLERYAGGLRPVSRGGGFQTRSLRFQAPDGRQFSFRSVDKDPTGVLPPELRETILQSVVRDQTSAQQPAGPVVTGPLLGAAGVLHSEPRLVALPDDTLLGPFRAEFAGMLGTFEERPLTGFAGASRIVSTDELLLAMAADPWERADAAAFLTARLLDVFVGDWDRHRGQWRWARIGDRPATPWQPLPEDRDQAFVKFDGLLLAVARHSHPSLVKFRGTYPHMVGQTWNGRDIDRQLLTGLERPVWDSIASSLQPRLTDAVIDSAVARLPSAYYRLTGPALGDALKRRRDRLPDAARRFYRLLAREVDVHGTVGPDHAEVERRPDGLLMVSLFDGRPGGGPAALAPYFRRSFDPRDTREVRIYLRGGDDRVVVRGEENRRITLRVIGGGGDDVLDDSSRAGGSLLYDEAGTDRASGRGVGVDRRPWTWDSTQANPTPTPPRDWTDWRRPVVWMSFSPDVGLLVGGGVAVDRYGFRQRPYASHRVLRAAYATTAQRFRLEYRGEKRRPNSGVSHTLQLRLSGIEVLRFYGFGNETGSSQAPEFYRVAQEQYSIQPDLHLAVAPPLTFSVGSMLTWVRTPARAGLIATLRPYGVGDFGQWGWRAGVTFDSRDVAAAPTRGLLLSVQGSVFPALFDVETPFGAVQGEAATYLTAPVASRPILALRAGGRKVFGTYPFHEAAFLGGPATVRGWPRERFAGDASLYGNAELRLHLTRFFLLLPGTAGVSAFADAGRVFYAGESSQEWHGSVGGGLWFAFLSPANTVSLTVGRSEERTVVYARAGFPF